jgi:hypothetical protein
VADLTLSPSRTFSPRFGQFAKRFFAVLVSYEVAAYGLATVQAMGLTLPAMVDASVQADPRVTCAANLHRIVVAAEDWTKNHPDRASHRPTLEELGQDIEGGLPNCPTGGAYEIVPAGQSIRIVDGPTAVIPAGRMAFRCGHAHDIGVIENPYEAIRRRQIPISPRPEILTTPKARNVGTPYPGFNFDRSGFGQH